MNSYGKFFVEFLTPFFEGFVQIFKSLFDGILKMFNIIDYLDTIDKFKGSVNMVFIIVAVLVLLLLIALLGFIIFFISKKLLRVIRKSHEQDSLLEEVEKLNYDMIKLKQENDKLMTMAESGGTVDEEGNPTTKIQDGESRFFKLSALDQKYKDNPDTSEYDDNLTLLQICDDFRNFSASQLGLYYTPELIRLFISAFGATRLLILQGISGTGKTSLAYAFGEYLNNPSIIASVQPSWRDRTELFGYFNEFTKRFNETELLAKMYEATYSEKVYITILDEMNIARVEYYFAEMLSIMEMPSKTQWIINLVAAPWESDPIKVNGGNFTLPGNMWYIGTINNDDSTFAVTDKVYDRAMPIDINEKCAKFEAPKTERGKLRSTHFEELHVKAREEHPLSQEMRDKLEEMDQYVIEHFRISFGNRIMRQIEYFTPSYVCCGGKEVDAIDYLIASKILRKFEQLNLAFIKNELDEFINYLNIHFGKDNMRLCKEFIVRLKKSI